MLRSRNSHNRMSCSSNKTDATTDFNAATYSASAALIQLSEETQSTHNECTIESVRGKIRMDLTDFHHGSCTVYFKVDTQTDGSSNSPPVDADSLFHEALAATMGIVNTSSYYANTTPTFSGSNDCSASDKSLGWILTDQTASVRPTFTYNV
jgi:hypothetical protein